jgi:hypothetical protein
MEKDELEKNLQNISIPQLPPLKHQQQLKLSILSARKSASAGLWLLLVPFVLFASAFLRQVVKITVPPDSWLESYRSQWPSWLRIAVFLTIMIVLPLIAVIINLLSIVWLQYERKQRVLNVCIRMRTINLIIIIGAGLVAFLFTVVMITD